MSVPTLVTERSVTFFVNSTPYQVDRSAEQYGDIVAELNKPNPDADTLIELADLSRKVMAQFQARVESTGHGEKAVQYLTKGVIAVGREGVTFNGEPIYNALADRLMQVLEDGFNLGPWVAFAENVYQNPADYSREELMLWLDKADLPITSDGCFLAYKIVRGDFKDLYKGQFDNSPGKLVALPGRQAVDPDRARTCSYGLHFCSKEYLPGYGGFYGGGNADRKIVLVKVNPADVVSIPSDYDNTKGRCWRYEVIEEIPAVEIGGQEWKPVANSWSNDYQNDDDYADYDEPEYDDYEQTEEEEEADAAAALEDAVREARHRAHVESGRETAGLGIVTLRQKAAALKQGNSPWIWKEADIKSLRKYLSDKAADRAEQAVRSGR